MIKYNVINNPLGFVMRKAKPKIHPIVSCYDEFNYDQKEKLSHIKSIVISRISTCTMYVFGSQINGNWDETSDFDIVVCGKLSGDDKRYLRSFDYGFKVDIAFTESTQGNRQIEF